MTTELWRSFPSRVRLPAGSDLNPESDRAHGHLRAGGGPGGIDIPYTLDRRFEFVLHIEDEAFSRILLVKYLDI